VIARKGVRGLRVQEVAQDAGVSVALIYHHFGDRANLLRCALLHVAERADEYTRRYDGKSGRQALISTVLEEVQDQPDVRENSGAWGELRAATIFDSRLLPTLAQVTDQWVADLADIIVRGHADGSISKSVDPQTTAYRLTALIEGLSDRWLAGLLTTRQTRLLLETGVLRELDGAGVFEGPEPV
jgi:AcrR family transcriptional regulator